MSNPNPYASPTMIDPAPPVGRPGEFQPTRLSGGVAQAGLAFCAMFALASMGSCWMQAELLDSFRYGYDEQAALANDQRHVLVNIAQLCSALFTIVAFMTWFFRSHRNLRHLHNPTTQWASGWSIGGWFIPFANLYIPCAVMWEMFNRSSPKTLPKQGDAPRFITGRTAPGVSIVGWWWALHLFMNFGGNIAGFMTPNPALHQPTLDDYIIGTYAEMTADVLVLIAAIPAILMIRTITANQIERRRAMDAMPQPVAEPGAYPPVANPFDPPAQTPPAPAADPFAPPAQGPTPPPLPPRIDSSPEHGDDRFPPLG